MAESVARKPMSAVRSNRLRVSTSTAICAWWPNVSSASLSISSARQTSSSLVSCAKLDRTSVMSALRLDRCASSASVSHVLLRAASASRWSLTGCMWRASGATWSGKGMPL